MSLKRLILFFTFLSFINAVQAQDEVDSLRKQLQMENVDSNRVKLYLSFFYTDLYYSNPEEVIQFAKQAASLSKQIAYKKGEVDAYNTLGYMYRIRSENDSALYYFEEGAELAEEIDFLGGMADAHTGLGNTYNQLGEWEKAIPHFEIVIKRAGKAGNNVLVASANNNIGNIYLSKGAYTKALEHYQESLEKGNLSIKETAQINIGLVHNQLGNFEKAKSYLQESIELCEKSGNKYALAFVYQHLGAIEQQSANYALAVEYFNKASAIFDAINERYNVSDIKTNLGNLYYDQAKYGKALIEFRESIAIQKMIEHDVGICNNLLAIGKVLLATKQLNAAEDTLLLADQLADTLQLLPAKSNITKLLSQLYESKGDLSKALSFSKVHKVLYDSLTNIEQSKLVAEMEAKYEVSQKEQEIELLSAENQVANLQLQKQQNLRNYLLTIAVILIILVAVGYSRYQIKVRANTKLRELDQVKTNFFTNISHEFRTPLTLILNPVEKILKTENDPAIKNDLHLVQRNAQRLLELTNQILDLSKLEAGKLKLVVQQHDLAKFIRMNVAAFESLAGSRNIDLSCEIDEQLNLAFFDSDSVQKILNNLLSNALKFTPAGGKVRVQALKENEFLMLSVEDNGKGIPSDQLTHIFDRFHQVDSSEAYGGTGIGLTLTKELVSLHHGTISAKSTAEKGSRFDIQIPISARAYHQAEMAEQEQETPTTFHETTMQEPVEEVELNNNKAIALIVEDNLDLIHHITAILQPEYKVVQAHNGKEGMAKAVDLIPDIIISDWMMPEMDGLELCKLLRHDERTSHIPLVMLTAKVDIESKLDGLKTGADEYLAKPFNTDELLIRMQNLINQREQLRLKYNKTIALSPSKVDVDNPDERFLLKILSIVEEHISDTDLTVEKLQKELGVSRMQLHRKLKALTGFSTSEFIRDIRLQRAADLLKANGIQVTEAAYQSGFNSLSYFTQCFKNKYGIAPSDYHKNQA